MEEDIFELKEGSGPSMKRSALSSEPRFLSDRSAQLDPIRGCPALLVPGDHLARSVKALVDRLDLSAFESRYSALGRRGYSPQSQLAVWVYASLIGVHSSLKLGRLIETDAALQFLSGGRSISSGTLRRFRNKNAELFEAAISQTVSLAHEMGLLPLDEGAVDSVRIRAHASTAAVRTVKRSRKRLAELLAQDESTMSSEEKEKRAAKIDKHTAALATCREAERSNVVLTNESAGLLKFPSGASAPGHRVTMAAFGVSERIVAMVLVDADSSDQGKLRPSIEKTMRALESAGVPIESPIRVTADAGYQAADDLIFAAEKRKEKQVDLLVATPEQRPRRRSGKEFFSRERFDVSEERVICPAGTPMNGPLKDSKGRIRFNGVGCQQCDLRQQCTDARQRTIMLQPGLEAARKDMTDRMSEDGAAELYNKRIATIEPVFANIESTMGYRRASSRHTDGARAEILLKVLAHNISRLASAEARLAVAHLEVLF